MHCVSFGLKFLKPVSSIEKWQNIFKDKINATLRYYQKKGLFYYLPEFWQNFGSPHVEHISCSGRQWSREFSLNPVKLLAVSGDVGFRLIFDPRFMALSTSLLLPQYYNFRLPVCHLIFFLVLPVYSWATWKTYLVWFLAQHPYSILISGYQIFLCKYCIYGPRQNPYFCDLRGTQEYTLLVKIQLIDR